MSPAGLPSAARTPGTDGGLPHAHRHVGVGPPRRWFSRQLTHQGSPKWPKESQQGFLTYSLSPDKRQEVTT